MPRCAYVAGSAYGAGAVFLLRREPLYHKLQYTKTPKFDVAGATLGVVVGALVVYLGLSSFGSAGADLTDLTVFYWYSGVWVVILRMLSVSWRSARAGTFCECSFFGFSVELSRATGAAGVW